MCNAGKINIMKRDSWIIYQSLSSEMIFCWCMPKLASTEFWVKFSFFPSVNNFGIVFVGTICVTVGQVIRSFAMITCGESFNQ